MNPQAMGSIPALLVFLFFVPSSQAQVDALGDPLPEGAIARLGTTRMRHFHPLGEYCSGIGSIAWSPDGKTIATSSYAHDVGVDARIWEASTGKHLKPLQNRERYAPTLVRFTPDSRNLAAAAGKAIVFWDVATGNEAGVLVGHRSDVDALAFQDGGKTMVSVSRDGTVLWWDVAGRKNIRQLQLLADDPKKTDEGKAILDSGIRHACFSSDGKTLAFSKWWATREDKIYNDCMAVVFDLSTCKRLWSEDTQVYDSMFAFSPDGKCLAFCRGCTFVLRDSATGRRLNDYQDISAWQMDFSPDGKTLALSVIGEIVLWSPEKKAILRKIESPLPGGGYNVLGARPAFSPDGTKLAIDRHRAFQILDLADGKPAVAWPSFDEGLSPLEFSQDGRTLFALNGAIAIDATFWRPFTPAAKPARKRFGVDAHVRGFSSDRTLCVAYDEEYQHSLYEVKTGRLLSRLEAFEKNAADYQGFFSPRATLYVACDNRCDKKETDTVFAIPSGKRLFQLTFDRFSATYDWSFSEDEKRMAYFDWSTGTARVHEAGTGKLLWQFGKFKGIRSRVVLSPNGKLLAGWSSDTDSILVWDLQTGELIRSLVIKAGRKQRVRVCLAWSPDDRMLAVGGIDNSVRLWEVASGQVRHEFRGHEAPADCLAFSRDGRILVSSSHDTTLLVWQLRPGVKKQDERKER